MKRSTLCIPALAVCLMAAGLGAEPLVEWNFNGGTPGNTFTSAPDTSGEIIATKDGFGAALYGTERTGGSGTSSVEFDGFSFLRVPDHPALSGFADETSALSSLEISAWVNPLYPHFGASQIVRKTDAMGYELFLVADNQVGFSVHGIGGSSTAFSLDETLEPLLLPSEEWSEIVGRWDGESGTISITVNGHETVEVSNTTLVPRTSNDLGIGGLIRTNNTTGQFFTGRIDDVRISGELSPMEPPPSLVEIARWEMEGIPSEDLGPIDGALDDYLGFVAMPENLGVSTSLTYVADPRPGSTGSTAAQFSNGGTVNNNGAILIIEDHPSQTGHFNNGTGYVAFETEMWVKPAEVGRVMVLLRKTDDSEVGFILAIQANGTVLARLEEASGLAVSQTTVNPVVVGEWYHIRAGFDINKPFGGEEPNFYLYVNDVARTTSNSVVAVPMVNTTTNLGIGGLIRVGNASKGQYFNGLMDDVVLRAAKVDDTTFESTVPSADIKDLFLLY